MDSLQWSTFHSHRIGNVPSILSLMRSHLFQLNPDEEIVSLMRKLLGRFTDARLIQIFDGATADAKDAYAEIFAHHYDEIIFDQIMVCLRLSALYPINSLTRAKDREPPI